MLASQSYRRPNLSQTKKKTKKSLHFPFHYIIYGRLKREIMLKVKINEVASMKPILRNAHSSTEHHRTEVANREISSSKVTFTFTDNSFQNASKQYLKRYQQVCHTGQRTDT